MARTFGRTKAFVKVISFLVLTSEQGLIASLRAVTDSISHDKSCFREPIAVYQAYEPSYIGSDPSIFPDRSGGAEDFDTILLLACYFLSYQYIGCL